MQLVPVFETEYQILKMVTVSVMEVNTLVAERSEKGRENNL